ncbi:hypothetical protein FIM12_04815 [SAR202 cluster bacterium AD-804-J14_MRT_500m]|nr:hypothetical protein [SAR202 cluster bacterium AD-804-J14_MRT_500m]
MVGIESSRNEALFQETQRFHQPWIWFIALGGVGVSCYILFQQLMLETAIEGGMLTTILVPIIAVFAGGMLPVFLLVAKLSTKITQDGIFIRLFPLNLSFRRISFDEITKYYIRTYNPIREYGGRGIRKGARGRAYTVSGNSGLQLDLANGESMLIGSLKSRCFADAIKKALDNQ